MSFLRKGHRLLIAGILPVIERSPDDIVDKENKTYKAYLASKPSEETGLERLKHMFSIELVIWITPVALNLTISLCIF